jgi:hypothetical protein
LLKSEIEVPSGQTLHQVLLKKTHSPKNDAKVNALKDPIIEGADAMKEFSVTPRV